MLGMNKVGNREVCHPLYKHRKTIPPAPLSRLQQAHN